MIPGVFLAALTVVCDCKNVAWVFVNQQVSSKINVTGIKRGNFFNFAEIFAGAGRIYVDLLLK